MSSLAGIIPKAHQDNAQLKDVACLRKTVADLRVQAGMERMPISQSVAELINAILSAQDEDPMLDGKQQKNPFTSQKKCDIL